MYGSYPLLFYGVFQGIVLVILKSKWKKNLFPRQGNITSRGETMCESNGYDFIASKLKENLDLKKNLQ